MKTVTNLAEARKEKEGFSIDDVLSGATSKKESKPTGKTPVVEIPEEMREKVSRFREIKETVDSLTTEADLLQAELIEVLEPMKMAESRKGYTSSLKVAGSDGLYLTVSWQHKYSKIDRAQHDAIEQVVGERYGQFFEDAMQITTKDNSEPTLRELIGLIGPENFARFFTVDRWLYPTKAYTESLQFFTDEQRSTLAPIVRQYKPSFKTK